MPGITPAEGRELLMRIAYHRTSPDRDADLELLLICNRSLSDGLRYAELVEPIGEGYERRLLSDVLWECRAESSRYAPQRWQAGPGGWVNAVTGYAIVTRSALGQRRVLHAELAGGPPQPMNELDTYEVEPLIRGRV